MPRIIRESFSFARKDHLFVTENLDRAGNSVLHLLACSPNLNLIQRFLDLHPHLALSLDSLLQPPLHLISHSYLTSKKCLLLATKIETKKSLRANGTLLLNSQPPLLPDRLQAAAPKLLHEEAARRPGFPGRRPAQADQRQRLVRQRAEPLQQTRHRVL